MRIVTGPHTPRDIKVHFNFREVYVTIVDNTATQVDLYRNVAYLTYLSDNVLATTFTSLKLRCTLISREVCALLIEEVL